MNSPRSSACSSSRTPEAGASAYRLSAYLPDTVEVCTVQLPGREARSAEPALTSLDEAVAALAPLIADHTDLPYAFFGHSMGSLIAFETARRLRALGMRLPDRLFLSGMRAPACRTVTRGTHCRTTSCSPPPNSTAWMPSCRSCCCRCCART